MLHGSPVGPIEEIGGKLLRYCVHPGQEQKLHSNSDDNVGAVLVARGPFRRLILPVRRMRPRSLCLGR